MTGDANAILSAMLLAVILAAAFVWMNPPAKKRIAAWLGADAELDEMRTASKAQVHREHRERQGIRAEPPRANEV